MLSRLSLWWCFAYNRPLDARIRFTWLALWHFAVVDTRLSTPIGGKGIRIMRCVRDGAPSSMGHVDEEAIDRKKRWKMTVRRYIRKSRKRRRKDEWLGGSAIIEPSSYSITTYHTSIYYPENFAQIHFVYPLSTYQFISVLSFCSHPLYKASPLLLCRAKSVRAPPCVEGWCHQHTCCLRSLTAEWGRHKSGRNTAFTAKELKGLMKGWGQWLFVGMVIGGEVSKDRGMVMCEILWSGKFVESFVQINFSQWVITLSIKVLASSIYPKVDF